MPKLGDVYLFAGKKQWTVTRILLGVIQFTDKDGNTTLRKACELNNRFWVKQ